MVSDVKEGGGKILNFGNLIIEILTKIWERKNKWYNGRGRKNLNFGNLITEILTKVWERKDK